MALWLLEPQSQEVAWPAMNTKPQTHVLYAALTTSRVIFKEFPQILNNFKFPFPW